MNSLDKKIIELQKMVESYLEDNQKAINENKRIDEEILQINRNEDDLAELLCFLVHKKGNKVDLIKKINLLKFVCDIIALLTLGVAFIGVISLGSVIAVLTGSTVVPNAIGTYVTSLIASICVASVGMYFLKKIERRHNLYCDKYFLNYVLFNDGIHDSDRISEKLEYLKKKKATLKEKKIELYKDNKMSCEKVAQLNQLIDSLTQYRDSLDDLINEVYQKNMPQELNESIQNSFVKAKNDERNKF